MVADFRDHVGGLSIGEAAEIQTIQKGCIQQRMGVVIVQQRNGQHRFSRLAAIALGMLAKPVGSRLGSVHRAAASV
jgi:hypothetical protein